jgi:hypothetical protein
MKTYAELIRQIARLVAEFDPQDRRHLLDAALKEAAKPLVIAKDPKLAKEAAKHDELEPETPPPLP